MNQDSDTILHNTRIMLIAVIGNVVAVYAFNIGIARLLSPENYGNYKVAESFFNLASIGVLLGGAPAALRFLPGLIQQQDTKAIWGYIRFYLVVIILASMVLTSVTLLGTWFWPDAGAGAEIHPLLYALAVVPLVALTSLFGSLLQAAQRMDLAFLPWWIGFPALKLLFVALLFLVLGSVSAPAAVLMALLATLVILFYQAFKAKHLGLLAVSGQARAGQPRSWLRVSVPMMFMVALQTAFNQVDIYMIEIVGQEPDVGHFAVASTVTLILFATQLAVMAVFEPLMAASLQAGPDSVRALNARCFRRLAAIALPLFAVIMLFPDLILSVFGDKYSNSIGALRLLAPGYLVSALLACSYGWLQYSGYERKAARVMLFGVVTNIILDAILIPHYGIEGAACATTLVFIGISTAFCTMARKYLRIFPWTSAA